MYQKEQCITKRCLICNNKHDEIQPSLVYSFDLQLYDVLQEPHVNGCNNTLVLLQGMS